MPPSAEMVTTEPVDQIADPWARWGWLFGGVWLFFFGFPLYFTWVSERGPTFKLGVTALIAAFMLVYIVTLRRATAEIVSAHYSSARHQGWIGLGVLLLIVVALGTLIGPNALTGMPFMVGLPVFFLSWRWVWGTSLSLLFGGVAISWILWGWVPSIMLWGISVVVLGVSVAARAMEERQESNRAVISHLELSEERERVARDVHDVLGHSLTVVTMKTELARRLIDVDPERAKAELAEVQDLSRTALAEIRATVAGLRVARLSDEVESARIALAGAGIEAKLPTDVSVVDPRHRITAAWVLREAVTNVVRHSSAQVCRVRLASDGLIVEDDGRGTGDNGEGNGIRGVRERVAQAGGEVEIGPGQDGRGTRLEVRL